jgi:hypothetical protein
MSYPRVRCIIAGLGLIGLWACNSRTLQTPKPTPTGTSQNFFDQTLTNKADILFMVDDSSSMLTVQQHLADKFPTFIQALETLPSGLPDVHIGVVTSTLGAGAATGSLPQEADSCNHSDGGRLVAAPRAPEAIADPRCATATLNVGQNFISASSNNTIKNFNGAIEDVFACIARVDAVGCGFEHQLQSTRYALGDPMAGITPPAENAGFLRDDAYLAIIWITNEDDCSAPAKSDLFNPNAAATDSDGQPLGPFASFRCTRYGVLCNQQRVPNTATTQALPDCVSYDTRAQTDPLHSLVPSTEFISWLHNIKVVPNHVVGAVIAAPPTPFQVDLEQTPAHLNWPELTHDCETTSCQTDPRCDPTSPQYDVTGRTCDCVFGDPAVRMSEVVGSLGQLGTFVSICQDDYTSAMQTIGNLLIHVLGKQCIEGELASPSSDFLAPISMLTDTMNGVVLPDRVSCTVRDVQFLGTAREVQNDPMDPCNPAGQDTGTCWAMVEDPSCTVSSSRIVVCRNGFDPNLTGKYCKDGPNMPPTADTAVIHCATVAQ